MADAASPPGAPGAAADHDDDTLSISGEGWIGRRVAGGPAYDERRDVTATAYQSMLELEGTLRSQPLTTDEQIGVRNALVQSIAQVAGIYGFSIITLHLAAQIVDRMLGIATCSAQNQPLIAMASVRLACKFEEVEGFAPGCYDIIKMYADPRGIHAPPRRGVHSDDEDDRDPMLAKQRRALLAMEEIVLRQLDWRLNDVTPVHFVRYVVKYDADDLVLMDTAGGGPASPAHLREFNFYASFVLRIAVHNYELQRYLPSVIGCACAAVARTAAMLDELWPHRLERLTGIAWAAIEPCARELMAYYNECYPNSALVLVRRRSPPRVTDFVSAAAEGYGPADGGGAAAKLKAADLAPVFDGVADGKRRRSHGTDSSACDVSDADAAADTAAADAAAVPERSAKRARGTVIAAQ